LSNLVNDIVWALAVFGRTSGLVRNQCREERGNGEPSADDRKGGRGDTWPRLWDEAEIGCAECCDEGNGRRMASGARSGV